MGTAALGHYLAVATLLSSLAVHRASAQVDNAGCAAAVERVRAALTSREYTNALGALRRCPSAGPAFIAGAWRAPSADSDRLRDLTYVSGEYRDERIFRALIATLLDDAQPRAVRLAATSALITQVSPCAGLGSSQTFRDRDSLYTIVTFSHMPDFSVRKGSALVEGQPLPRVLRAFSDLASSSSDTMRSHARGVLRQLQRVAKATWFNCTP